MRQAWEFLKDNGTSNGVNVPQYRDMHELMGFSEVWDFEKKWAPVNGTAQFFELICPPAAAHLAAGGRSA